MFKTFYLVWNPSTGYTNYRHDNLMSAENEAERLANKHGASQEFYILEAKKRCKYTTVIWEEGADLPF